MNKAEVLRTGLEIEAADEREEEIQSAHEAEEEAIRLEFNTLTAEAWSEYEAIWKPAREKWEAFSRPHFETMTTKRAANYSARLEALSEVRRDWKKCPNCGTLAARFQGFCLNEKCQARLIEERL